MLALLGDVTRPQFYGKSVGIYQLFGDVGGSLGPTVGLESGLHFGMLPTYLAAGALLIESTPVALWIFGPERKWRRMQSKGLDGNASQSFAVFVRAGITKLVQCFIDIRFLFRVIGVG